ncbi:C40 family peptidase [Enteractinococcus coprophilus]|uniref:Cell wall-associated NlpC family hydrolase n=1 Tax=Enteractinococcus coprophilus TaxID=1027633 RepID=A0A543AGN3_9MICC|nr:C40 family peptidase [Enteractinococcus coprophilus]TQL71730.1 cell wall-associated NlpC family hydrolase [Enteractinococcus coprophilus]
MKSRSVKGAAAGVALVTVAAMSATAMPQIFSESDTVFAKSTHEPEATLTEVPDLPDKTTIAKAKENPDAQAKLREDLKKILDKSNQRLADAEGETLSANEKARELGEAAAEARREAETAAQQAQLAAEEHELAQEEAGEAVADMYRNGSLTTEEFLLGDEDALAQDATEQQLANSLAGDVGTAQQNQNAAKHLEGEATNKSEAAEEAAKKAQEKAEEEERKKREEQERLERLEQQRLEAAAEAQRLREETAAALAASGSDETVDDLDNEVRQEYAAQNNGGEVPTPSTSATSTEQAQQAPVTPTEEPTPEASPTPSSTPTQTATQSSAPTATSSPTQRAAQTPPATQTPTATRSATPTPTPTPTPTQTRTSTPTPTPTKTQAPKPKPAPQQVTAASAGSNMSAAVNWAVNKTNEAGTSYVWGGNGPKGYDCSGFTSAAFAQSGKSLPRQSKAQYGAAKQYVSLNNLRPGDLVFWSNNGQQSGVYHVAIYIGNGQIAHARNPSTGITVTGLHYSPYNMMSVGGRY